MIAFPSMLEKPATDAGIEVPADSDQWETTKDEFPHFFIFCALQLGAPMPSSSSHWYNAKIIAAIDESELKTITLAQLVERGFETGYPLV